MRDQDQHALHLLPSLETPLDHQGRQRQDPPHSLLAVGRGQTESATAVGLVHLRFLVVGIPNALEQFVRVQKQNPRLRRLHSQVLLQRSQLAFIALIVRWVAVCPHLPNEVTRVPLRRRGKRGGGAD